MRPKWIAGHLLALALVVLFVTLGFWQLGRHAERAERNAAIEAGLDAPPAPLDRLPPEGRDYRRALVRGRYLADAEVLLTPRTEHGPGHHVLVPLRLDDGRLLVVDRGWVPFQLDTPPLRAAEPPTGEVQVSGVLLPATEVDPRAVHGEGGRLLRVAAVDPVTVAGEGAVTDVFLLRDEETPAGGELPLRPAVPSPEAGPHLSYAVQWFLFALVGVVGYPILLHRVVSERRAEIEAA